MNTIFPTSIFCWPTIVCGPGPVIPQTGYQGAAPQMPSLPGCVQQTVATVCTQVGCPPQLSLPGCVPHTMWFVCPPHISLPGCVQHTQLGCPPHISLPGCVHTGACPPPAAQANAAQTAATTCTQIACSQADTTTNMLSAATQCPTVAPMCPPPANGGGQAQAQGVTFFGLCPQTLPVVCIPSVICQQAAGGQAQGQNQAQALTLFGLCPQSVVCPPPTIICQQGNAGGQGQAQAQGLTFLGICPPSIPPIGCIPSIICQQAQASPQGQAYTGGFGCPNTISCPPQPQGGQGVPYTHLIGCPNTSTCSPQNAGGQAQAQTIWHTQPGYCNISVPPHCPTVAPMCPPANGGGQAQAQGVTFLGICPPTLIPAVCVVTQLAGCGSVTGIPIIC